MVASYRCKSFLSCISSLLQLSTGYVVDCIVFTACDTGKEDLSFNFNLDGKIGFVADALYLAAHGLHDMIRDHCPDEVSLYVLFWNICNQHYSVFLIAAAKQKIFY